MSTSARRPGPLRELPLEQFLHESIPTAPARSNKRPLSPSAPNLFSPTKRRILTQEGIFSPDKVVKSPLSSSSGGGGRFAPLHFQDLLSGPCSPARRLDFGSSSSSPTDSAASSSQLFADLFADPVNTTPMRVVIASSSKPQPSPEFPPQTLCEPVEDYFDLSSEPDSGPQVISHMVSSQSIHYPGFDVWHDSGVGDTPTTPLCGILRGAPSSPANKLKDEDKENLAPQRKPRKSTTSPGASHELLKGALLSPCRKRKEVDRSGRGKSIQVTPAVAQSRDGSTTPTARLTGLELTPRRPTNVDKEELKKRRMRLASEVDGDEGDGDEL